MLLYYKSIVSSVYDSALTRVFITCKCYFSDTLLLTLYNSSLSEMTTNSSSSSPYFHQVHSFFKVVYMYTWSSGRLRNSSSLSLMTVHLNQYTNVFSLSCWDLLNKCMYTHFSFTKTFMLTGAGTLVVVRVKNWRSIL